VLPGRAAPIGEDRSERLDIVPTQFRGSDYSAYPKFTASIGYARFPLPPHAVPLSWEQAINLVDLALYVAKSEGRHRAIGVTGSSAASVQALQAVEADFDRARQDGRVTLVRAIGVGLPIAA
jgi:predicted signal transduction protein with EAL and GGDEF domain